MRKFVALIALFALLLAVSASAQPEWKTASKVGIIAGASAGTTNIDCGSSAALLANYGWTKGNVVGLKAWAKGPFRIQIWKGGSGSTVWTPVDTTSTARGVGAFTVEFPCVQTFWVEADSFKCKPASSDTVRYELYKN